MKIMIRKQIMCLLMVCALISAPLSVYAETTGTTEAQVEFTAGTGPTLPVNPEVPDENIETEPAVTGSLAIVTISDFNFGAISVTGRAGLYDITTYQPNIQVVDLRGVGTGWSVNASVSGFTSGGAPSLPGSRIHIYNGRPNSLTSLEFAPTQVADLALTTDSTDTRVITASAGNGSGLWIMRWYPPLGETAAYIQLEIPAGIATVGTHTATINWTLGDTP